MADDARYRIEKFNGSNFAIWKMQIEDLLYLKKLYVPLGGFDRKPESMTEDEWMMLDRSALSVIRLSLDSSVLFNIANETTSAGLMAALARMYEKPSASNKVFLMKRLFNLKMKEGGSVAGHLNDFNTVMNQLSSVGLRIEDEMRALLVLSSLPDSYEGLVTAVSNSSGSSALKYDDVVGVVLNEEVRKRANSGASCSGSALNVDGRDQSGGSSNQNHGRGRSRTRKGGIECWNCGKKGHVKRECKNPRKKEDSSLNYSVDDPPQDALVLASHKAESWIVDSGASCHATAHRYIFSNYVAGCSEKMRLADNKVCRVAGIGDVDVRLGDGSKWRLHGVRHVPRLRWNLVSVRQLADDGCLTTFTGDGWKVTKGILVLARGRRDGSMFVTESGIDGDAVRMHRRRSPKGEEEVQVRFSGVREACSIGARNSRAQDGEIVQGDHIGDARAAVHVLVAGGESSEVMSSRPMMVLPTSGHLSRTDDCGHGVEGEALDIGDQGQWELAMGGEMHSTATTHDILARLHSGKSLLPKLLHRRRREHGGARRLRVGTASRKVTAEVALWWEARRSTLGQARELLSLGVLAAREPEKVFAGNVSVGESESGATPVVVLHKET